MLCVVFRSKAELFFLSEYFFLIPGPAVQVSDAFSCVVAGHPQALRSRVQGRRASHGHGSLQGPRLPPVGPPVGSFGTDFLAVCAAPDGLDGDGR